MTNVVDLEAYRAQRRWEGAQRMIIEIEREELLRRELEDAINADRYARGLPPIIVIR